MDDSDGFSVISHQLHTDHRNPRNRKKMKIMFQNRKLSSEIYLMKIYIRYYVLIIFLNMLLKLWTTEMKIPEKSIMQD